MRAHLQDRLPQAHKSAAERWLKREVCSTMINHMGSTGHLTNG